MIREQITELVKLGAFPLSEAPVDDPYHRSSRGPALTGSPAATHRVPRVPDGCGWNY